MCEFEEFTIKSAMNILSIIIAVGVAVEDEMPSMGKMLKVNMETP